MSLRNHNYKYIPSAKISRSATTVASGPFNRVKTLTVESLGGSLTRPSIVSTFTRPAKKDISRSNSPALFVGSITSSSFTTKKYFLADCLALSSSSTVNMINLTIRIFECGINSKIKCRIVHLVNS